MYLCKFEFWIKFEIDCAEFFIEITFYQNFLLYYETLQDLLNYSPFLMDGIYIKNLFKSYLIMHNNYHLLSKLEYELKILYFFINL